jgi:hypothetical protein
MAEPPLGCFGLREISLQAQVRRAYHWLLVENRVEGVIG